MRVFLAGNTVIILSSCQLKMRILMLLCSLCWRQNAIKLQKHNVKFEETFGVAAQLSLQTSWHREQRAASKATASTSAGGPPPPKQQKLTRPRLVP